MSNFSTRGLSTALFLTSLACNVYAVDGVILIDQTRALTGGVTPGDTPGFPITLSQPGSYRLTGNLTVPNATTAAITIGADNITIDLNGFSIIGPTVCTTSNSGNGPIVNGCSPAGTAAGIDAGFYPNNPFGGTTVTNGSIRGMGFGIVLRSGTVKDVKASSNAVTGIVIGEGTAIGNDSSRNGFNGISMTGSGVVTGNFASGNAKGGITTGNFSVIKDNTVVASGGIGIQGSGTMSGNAVSFSGSLVAGGTGLKAECPSTVAFNTLAFNNNLLSNLILNGSGCIDTNNIY